MKVLIIGPYPVRNNGISQYIAELRGEWIRQGHKVETERMYFWREKSRNFRWFSLILRLNQGFDGVVVQHTPTASGPLLAFFLKVARRRRIPVVLESHETPATYAKHLPAWLRPLYHAYERNACRLAAATWVHTAFHRQELLDIGVNGEVDVLPLPVYGPSSSEVQGDARDSWGYYGMISAKKGLDILLDAYQAVPPGHYPPLRILGTAAPGEEAYVASLHGRVKAEYGAHITWVGYVEEERLPEEFARITAMIFPYRWVSQSAALAQTCYYRLPYLASDIPFFREFQLSYGCGQLFVSESLSSLSQALEDLKINPLRPETLPFDALIEVLGLKHCVELQSVKLACYARVSHV